MAYIDIPPFIITDFDENNEEWQEIMEEEEEDEECEGSLVSPLRKEGL